MPAGHELERLAETALAAAMAGGAVVDRAHRDPRAGLHPERKASSGDYVTETDRASERAVAGVLESETGLPVLGEEEGGRRAERYWVVDPLDGTTNFIHGHPIVGVSVALIEHGRPAAGAVHAPLLGSSWLGARGSGAEARDGSGPAADAGVGP